MILIRVVGHPCADRPLVIAKFRALELARGLGLEPRSAAPKAAVLPLDDPRVELADYLKKTGGLVE